MSDVTGFVLIPVAAGWAYWLAAWWCVRRRIGRGRARGSGGPRSSGDGAPISVPKPLKGAEPDLYDNLASFCRQDIDRFELLFGVRDADDPAVEAVRRLQRAWPERRILLAVAPELGLNPKSAILHELTQCARHDVLVISDSDIRVEPDYLRRVTEPLRDPRVGVVTCLYRARAVPTLPATFEALYTDFTFLPSVAVASTIGGVPIALGATVALRRGDLLALGGYKAIADHLADDYAVGAMLARSGRRCHISDCVVEHLVTSRTWREVWERGVRSARTIRSVEPYRYLGLPLIFVTPWATLLVAASGGERWAWGVLGATVLLRTVVAGAIARTLGDTGSLGRLVWLPLRDWLDVPLWWAGLLCNRVTWRGTTYRVLPDGRLARPAPSRFWKQRARPAGPRLGLLRWLVRQLDRRLRAHLQIFEFTDDPECILRARWARAPHAIALRDGTRIAEGERYLELHLWNEHVPKLGAVGRPTLAWAATARRRLLRSLVLLAAYLETRDDVRDVQAVHGRSTFLARDAGHTVRFLLRLGFELHESHERPTLRSWLHERGENLLMRALAWAFNPAPGQGRRSPKRPQQVVWMSRETLLSRYGSRRDGHRAARAVRADRSVQARGLPTQEARR